LRLRKEQFVKIALANDFGFGGRQAKVLGEFPR